MQDNNSFLTLFLQPVAEHLADDDVSEILINGPERVYVERKGRLEEVPARFVSEPALKAAAANIAASPSPSFRPCRASARSSPSASSRRTR